MNPFKWLIAKIHTWSAPSPIPLAMLPETIHDDIRQEPVKQLSQTETVVFEAAPQKPRRKRKPATPVTVFELPPQPETVDPFLEKLRQKRPRRNNDDEIDRLPAMTSIATVQGSHFYRYPDESLDAFVTRVRGILGNDAPINWVIEPQDKTRLDIVQNHLRRPLKAQSELPDLTGILPEDLPMQGTHGTVH
jgi:hypothetical protein